jgi:hypothetical protein
MRKRGAQSRFAIPPRQTKMPHECRPRLPVGRVSTAIAYGKDESLTYILDDNLCTQVEASQSEAA